MSAAARNSVAAACFRGSICSANDIGDSVLDKKTGGHFGAARIKLKAESSLRGFGLQRVLGDLHQLAERSVVRRRDVRQHLAVKAHLRGLQALHEAAVSRAEAAR